MATSRRPCTMSLPESIWDLVITFEAAGHQLYLVGGAVRDAVLGLKPKDHDVATDATPDQVIHMLSGMNGWRTDEVGRSFGVVRARPYDRSGNPLGDEHEIATFRRDIGSGRRPGSVVFTTIDEDVLRRDFTVNALFYDIRRQEVVDLVGGLADIEAGVVRTVGRPEDRFSEDRLRILRAVRFAARFGWSIDPATRTAIANDPSLEGVSPERIHDELVKAITSAKSVPVLFDTIQSLGLWPHVLPGLRTSVNPDSSVSTRGIDTNVFAVAMAVLLDAEDPNVLRKALVDLKFSVEEAREITFLLRLKNLTAREALSLRSQFASSTTHDHMVEYRIVRDLPDRYLFNAFLQYMCMTAVKGDDLLVEGYSGRALGEELRRRETILFEGLLTGDNT